MSTPRFSVDAAEWVPPSVRSGASHENGGQMKFTPDELRRARSQSLSLQYFRDMSRWLEAVHGDDAVYLRNNEVPHNRANAPAAPEGEESEPAAPVVVSQPVSLEKAVKEADLSTSSAPWRPGQSIERGTVASSVKSAKTILNKLTAEKFERLARSFLEIPLANIEHLRAIVETLVDTEQEESHFAELYARLAQLIHEEGTGVWAGGDAGGAGSSEAAAASSSSSSRSGFRWLLLDECQRAFFAEPDRSTFARMSAEDREEAELHRKSRRLGLCRFLAELAAKGVLPLAVIHQCVQRLLREADWEHKGQGKSLEEVQEDARLEAQSEALDAQAQSSSDLDWADMEDEITREENKVREASAAFHAKETESDEKLEMVVEILQIAGETMEQSSHARSREFLDAYMAILRELSARKGVLPRIRFLLEGLQELRSLEWVPRRKKDTASWTLAQVHEDAKLDELEKMNPQAAAVARAAREAAAAGFGEDDGWEVAGAAKRVLEKPANRQAKRGNRSQRGGGGGGRGHGRGDHRSSQQRSGGRDRSVEHRSQATEAAGAGAPEIVDTEPPLPADQFKALSKELVDEWLTNGMAQFEDLAGMVRERLLRGVLGNASARQAKMLLFVQQSLDHGLNHSDVETLMRELPALWAALRNASLVEGHTVADTGALLESHSVLDGFMLMLEYLEDLRPDIPFVARYLGSLLGHAEADRLLSLASVASEVDSTKGGSLATAIQAGSLAEVLQRALRVRKQRGRPPVTPQQVLFPVWFPESEAGQEVARDAVHRLRAAALMV